MPKVSVILPNYNHGHFLEERISSILCQTFTDFELIILDDCSNDNSRSVIERFRTHSKVSHLIYNETNSGSTFQQWRKGIELATGQYIWIAESDDWCEPGLLETLVAGMEIGCVLAYAQSLVVDSEGRILWNSRAESLKSTQSGIEFVSKSMLARNSIFNASMALFRRDCFDRVGNEFMDFKFCGDWLFWILIARQGDVFISGKILNYFRKHGADVSGVAYRMGFFYDEYFRLIGVLLQREVISHRQHRSLLRVKFLEFLKDQRMTIEAKIRVRKTFHSLIGSEAYLICAKVQFYQWKKRAWNIHSCLLL